MTLGVILLALGAIGLLVAQVWMIIVAFQNDEKVYGILFIVSFFVPIGIFVLLAFLVLKWNIARRPGILFLSCLPLVIVGFLMFANGAGDAMAQAAQAAETEAQARQATRTERRELAPPTPQPEPSAKPETKSEPRRLPPTPSNSPTPTPAPSTAANNSAATGAATNAPAASDRELLLTCPVRVELASLGDASPNQLRTLRLRLMNPAKAAVTELKLDLGYLDDHNRRLGNWKTVHSGIDPLASAGATNEFDMQAFFVPQFTRNVHIDVQAVRFADDTRWPPSR